jgi:hypothetical protein
MGISCGDIATDATRCSRPPRLRVRSRTGYTASSVAGRSEASSLSHAKGESMSSQPAFCIYCGAPLPPGSAVCGSCGQRVAAAPAAPQGPAAYPPPSPPPPTPPATPTTAAPRPRRRSAARATAKKRGPSVGSALLLTLVSLMLIFFGLRGPILQVAGATATSAYSACASRARSPVSRSSTLRTMLAAPEPGVLYV